MNYYHLSEPQYFPFLLFCLRPSQSYMSYHQYPQSTASEACVEILILFGVEEVKCLRRKSEYVKNVNFDILILLYGSKLNQYCTVEMNGNLCERVRIMMNIIIWGPGHARVTKFRATSGLVKFCRRRPFPNIFKG